MISVCHMIPQNQLIVWSCDFIDKNHPRKVSIMLRLMALGPRQYNIFNLSNDLTRPHDQKMD